MIEITNATKRFGDKIILDSINLTIKNGENVILMGQNGAGKTSLIRAILGEYILDSGNIFIDTVKVAKHRIETLSKISFVPQLPPPLKITVKELIDYTSTIATIDKNEIVKYSDTLHFDVKQNLNKPFFKLSGGMKQKLLISIALAKQSDIFIFDEPTANLDSNARGQFSNLLEKIDSKIFIFISHRIEEVGHIANRAITMDLAKVVSDEIL
ncbi:MAG: ABC transporter ATP-binding protein [Sulfuricurvum sp.]|nr:ABC transporter ATP-binding protein [Sulfuricurvum sp.]MDD5385832.1 ABC transporter ATP-binding protein [Sulfuricurvum sp.]